MTEVLRAGLLEGVRVRVAAPSPAVEARCGALGAEVTREAADVPPDVLVADATAPFTAAGGGVAGLRAGVDACWEAVHETVNAGWASGEVPGGKVVLLAPRDGEHAAAVGEALENTARTLSVEWARFGVRVVAVRPGAAATDAEVAELVAWLASPAGDYVSGCALAPGTLAVA